MDQDPLVKSQIDGAERLIVQLRRDGFRVTMACWAKTAEEGIWYLYIASPEVEENGPAAAYRAVQASLQRCPDSWLKLPEIKLIGDTDAMTRHVQWLVANHPRRVATLYGGKQLGGLPVDEAYIYPPHLYGGPVGEPMTREEVIRQVIELMDRTGVLQASTVTLSNGTTFSGVPIGVELNNNMLTVKFVVDPLHSPQNYPVAEIAEIR